MGLLKRTYSLPASTIDEFEKHVPAGQRSNVLAELLHGWLEQRRRERLRQDVIAGCKEMADVYLEIEREYHPLEEEVQRALDASTQTRRRGPHPARSRRRA